MGQRGEQSSAEAQTKTKLMSLDCFWSWERHLQLRILRVHTHSGRLGWARCSQANSSWVLPGFGWLNKLSFRNLFVRETSEASFGTISCSYKLRTSPILVASSRDCISRFRVTTVSCWICRCSWKLWDFSFCSSSSSNVAI